MKQPARYDTSSLPEARFEPGSRGRVLKNRLGIEKKKERIFRCNQERLEQGLWADAKAL